MINRNELHERLLPLIIYGNGPEKHDKMIYNTSYTNEDFIRESDEILGKAYGFFAKIKMGGIGSSRLIVEDISPDLKPKNLQTIDPNFSNIELRPKGIIVNFTNRLDRYAWIVPFYRLVTYSNECFSIHANGSFIKFAKNKNFQNNKNFFSKMMELKIDHLDLGYYDS